MTFLGHVVAEQGVRPDPKNTAAINDVPALTTVKQLQSFLEMAAYYCHYDRGFSDIAVPLYQLMVSYVPWAWTNTHDSSFCTLKKIPTSRPIMVYPDFTLPFRVYTDAGDLGLGVILAQVQDNWEWVITYNSQTVSKSIENYSPTKK